MNKPQRHRKVRMKPTAACILLPGAFLGILLGLLLARPWLPPLQPLSPASLALLFGSIAVGLFLVYGRDNRRQRQLIEEGDQIAGNVREIMRGNRLYRIRVEYRYKGHLFNEGTGNLLQVLRHNFVVNQEVTLFVDRTNPQSFVVYEASAFSFTTGA